MTAVASYGLKLAESVRFPPSIVPRAKLIYRDLKASEELENTVRTIFHSDAPPFFTLTIFSIADYSTQRSTQMFGTGKEFGLITNQ